MSDVKDVIEGYLGPGKPSGEGWLSFKCPFHKGGQERNASFAVNILSGYSKCWACDAGGPFDKLLRDLRVSDNEVQSVMAELSGKLRQVQKEAAFKRRTIGISKDPFKVPTVLPETILTLYKQQVPTRLLEAGFKEEWLRYMEIGTDEYNQRITYPIRDIYGHLGGVAGGAMHPGQEPKYLVYEGSRTFPDGVIIPSHYGSWFDEVYPKYRLENRNYLWNFDKVYPVLFFSPTNRYLVVVEGYKACLWLLQAGIPHVAALMGKSLTSSQRDQLLRLSVPIIFFLDNNQAGVKGTYYAGGNLHRARGDVYVARYPDNREQPDNLTAEECWKAVLEPKTYNEFRTEALVSGVLELTQRI